MLNDLLAAARGRYRAHRRAYLAVAGVLFVLVVYSRAANFEEFFRFGVFGVAAGCVYAIAASGLVLTYSTTGVFNFAHGAVGMFSAFLYWQLTVDSGLPAIVGILVVVVIVAPLLGLVTELMFRRFKDADISTTIVLTVALTVFLIGITRYIFKEESRALPRIFGARNVDVWQARLTWDQASYLVIAVLVAFGLRYLLFRSRTGVAMRAVVDNPNLAALNGARPTTVARVSWVLGAELAAIAGVLIAPATNPLDPIVLTFFVVNSFGAAVFGKLRSLPMTFVGGILLGLVQNWATFALPDGATWRRVNVSLPGVFLFFALLALPQARLTVGRVVGRRAPRVPGLRQSLLRAAVFVAAIAVVGQLAPDHRLTSMTQAMVFSLILLSLVVLTGFSGQVSLAQYVFVALGAWAMGNYFGGDSILSMLMAGLVAIPLGVMVALPALRLQGLYLALVTFGFATVARELLLEDPRVYGEGTTNVGRLELFGVSFASDQRFFVLCAAVFALFSIAVLALKRGSYGRRLAAMRDSQAACATLGLDVRMTKLTVFCISAFIAGVAGALFGGNSTVAGSIQFDPINNIVLFLFAVVGGITTVTGAFIGGVLFAFLPVIEAEQREYAGLAFAAVAAGAISLGRQPNGIAGVIYEGVHRLRERGRPGAAVGTPAATVTATGEEAPVGAPA